MIVKNLIKFPILKRLIPSVFKKYIFFTGNYLREKKINKILYYLDTRHLIDRNFYLRENYEDELFLSAKNLIILNKVNYFLDIGCCWGIYSLRLSNIPKLKILSFDPIKKNIIRFLKMIKKNNIKNIKVFNQALGEKKGKVKLYGLEEYTPNYSIHGKKTQNIHVSKIKRLDETIKIKNKVLYFKVDIEGHEYPFLKGANKILSENKVILQIEVFKKNKKKVFQYLKKNKFNLFKNADTDFFFSNFKIKKF